MWRLWWMLRVRCWMWAGGVEEVSSVLDATTGAGEAAGRSSGKLLPLCSAGGC
jgi:hypothetical protein